MQMPAALAPAALRPHAHDSRMSAVDHLEELRARLIVCLLAISVAFGLCFWQNHPLLRLVNTPLAHNTQAQVRAGHGPLGSTYSVQRSARDVAKQVGSVAGILRAQPQNPAAAATLTHVQRSLNKDVTALSAAPQGNRPVTLGIGEPFTSTLMVTLVFALILSLPIVLLQAYGFFMPALSPTQRRHMLPVTAAIPLLFAAGRGVRLHRRASRRPALLSELQQRPVQRPGPGQPVLQVRGHGAAGDGPAVPDPRRDHRRHPGRAGDPGAAAQEPALRGAGLLRDRRRPARRPDHDAAGDPPAVRAVRGQRADRRLLRAPRPAPRHAA